MSIPSSASPPSDLPESSAALGGWSEIYRNRLLGGGLPSAATAAGFAVQILLAVLLGVPTIGLGVAAIVSLGVSGLLYALVFGGVGVLVLALSTSAIRRTVPPILASRRYLQSGQLLASVEGVPGWSRRNRSRGPQDTMTVGGRVFDMNLTATSLTHDVLQQHGRRVRVWYVPATGVIVSAEARTAAATDRMAFRSDE